MCHVSLIMYLLLIDILRNVAGNLMNVKHVIPNPITPGVYTLNYTYIWSSDPKGFLSSFKTLDLVADQSSPANSTYAGPGLIGLSCDFANSANSCYFIFCQTVSSWIMRLSVGKLLVDI
jgi:hypothetical protein